MSLPVEKRQEILSSDAAEVIGGNEDLLTKILRSLPVRSLLRFRSVSKRWCSLISHPTFSFLLTPKPISGIVLRLSFRSKNFPTHYFNFYVGFRGEHTSSNPFVDDPFDMKIVNSCNGLFLCSASSKFDSCYICNPTTKKIVATLPLPLSDPVQRPAAGNFQAMTLAFDPYKSPHCKVVLVHRHESAHPSSLRFQVQVYSTETGTWRLPGYPFNTHYSQNLFVSRGASYPSSTGVFVNGIIYWPNIMKNSLLCFDVDKEELSSMPLPPVKNHNGDDVLTRTMPRFLEKENERRKIGYFGESGGHLQLIMYNNFASGPFDVLEMEGDYSRWFVKYHVDLDYAIMTTLRLHSELIWPSPPNPNGYSSEFSVLSIVRREDEDESFMVLYISGKVVSYNFKTQTLKKLCDLVLEHSGDEGNFLDSGYLRTHQYMETLYCV